jgi:hypothetical protein
MLILYTKRGHMSPRAAQAVRIKTDRDRAPISRPVLTTSKKEEL